MAFSEDPAFGEIYSANLTAGANGIGRSRSDEEIAVAIWYGVKADGTPTVGMPYEFHQAIHVGDMENLIAYLRSAPPVDTDYPAASYGPMLRVMHAANLFPLVAAEKTDGDQPPPGIVSPDDTLAYGGYLAVYCTACHGPILPGLPSRKHLRCGQPSPPGQKQSLTKPSPPAYFPTAARWTRK
jgi:hypothetical protein